MLAACCCSARAMAASIRAITRLPWVSRRASGVCGGAVGAGASASCCSVSSAASGAGVSSPDGVPSSVASVSGASSAALDSVSAWRTGGASLLASGSVTLRLCQPPSGSLRLRGPMTCGQSALSLSPGSSITAPLASPLLAGSHRARKSSSAACSCCCSLSSSWRCNARVSSSLRSGRGTRSMLGVSFGDSAVLAAGSLAAAASGLSSAQPGRARVQSSRQASNGRARRGMEMSSIEPCPEPNACKCLCQVDPSHTRA